MPTFQSSPMYYPVFPSMVHNPHGVQPLKGNTLAHAEIPTSEHPTWKKQADFAVMARLENNRVKELEMMRGPVSRKGNMPFTTFRGKLSGGTVWTADAEKSIQSLLRDRKFQLDAINQSSFDAVAPQQVKTEAPAAETFPLDQLFTDLLSNLDASLINKSLLSTTSSIMNFFLTKADKIPEHKFAEYQDILTRVEILANDLYYKDAEGLLALELSKSELANVKRVLAKLENDLSDMKQFIAAFSNYNSEPSKKKALRLAAIRNKLLQKMDERLDPKVAVAEARQRAYEQGEAFGPGEAISGDSDTFSYQPPSESAYGTLPSQAPSYAAPSNASVGTDEGPPSQGRGFRR